MGSCILEPIVNIQCFNNNNNYNNNEFILVSKSTRLVKYAIFTSLPYISMIKIEKTKCFSTIHEVKSKINFKTWLFIKWLWIQIYAFDFWIDLNEINPKNKMLICIHLWNGGSFSAWWSFDVFSPFICSYMRRESFGVK